MIKMESEAFISESPDHKIKLEYVVNDKRVTTLWEPKGNDMVLLSNFNIEGGLLNQRLFKAADKTTKDIANDFIDQNGIEDIRESVFEDIRLDKECPSCKSKSLARFAEFANTDKIPIIPMYICKKCNSRSYYLTDDYLTILINEHKDLFEEAEIKESEEDFDKFRDNVKEYISRVMAMNKVIRIKS